MYEQINKMWYIHTMKNYYSAIRKSEVLVHATTERTSKNKPNKRTNIVEFNLYEVSRIGKFIETK